ncbi:hypothetical protein CXB51_004875 [Gossypium anomalum]|uniref:Integrase catalytic domain-containing protein n=1 Tax=Gossypium anomalum TaxID=47600 RepID=A0A8J5ZVT3_9ROSI|nr:hypothetical protein CXB51_004875 [Gossypium anomalum]
MPLQVNMAHQSRSNDRSTGHDKGIGQSKRGSQPPYRGSGYQSFRGRGRGRRFAHNKPQCQLCGRIGHVVQKCYYRFDKSFEEVSDQSMQVHCHQFQDVSSSSCGGSPCYSHRNLGLQVNTASTNDQQLNKKVWYPDCGASNHVTSDLDNLHEATQYTSNNRLFMGNGVSVPIAHISSSSFASSNKDIKTGTILLVGLIHNGLYQFNLSDSQCPRAASTFSATAHTTSLELPSSSSSIFDLWHKRLGHPYNKTLGKSHKLPFSPSTTVYTAPFELLVTDIWGPAPMASKGHFYYIFFLLMHTQDWEGEFRSFPKVLSQLGVYHYLSCPYTSKQNGLVERKYQHLVDTGLTFLAQANMPMHFWAHAFISAAYLVNRLPTVVLAGRSPYEVLHKVVPSYEHLKVFDCSPVHKGYKCLETTCGRPGFQHQQSSAPVVMPSGSQHRVESLTVPATTSSLGQLPLESTNLNMQSDVRVSQGVASFSDVSAPTSNSPTSSRESLACNPPVNVHPMQTRSKNGIFKPKVFSAELSETEPATIEEALASKEWALAAQQEYEALLKNETWDLVPLPENRRVVGCKWVFKDIFSPVVKPTTIRLVLALAVQFGWQLRQVDINDAFLNGNLSEDIYMLQTPRFEQNHGDKPLVCKLKKAPYGLKQAPRVWFSKLQDFLLSSQFSLAKTDGSLFIKKTENVLLYVLVYVDDIIIIGNHQASIDQFVIDLDTHFSLKDLGPLNYFLGIEVSPTLNGLFLSQRKYVLNLLRKAKMDQANGSPTPMVTSSILSQHTGCAIENASEYRSIVRTLQYVVITKLDIIFAINKVCQFMHRPLDQHFKAVKRILRYLQGTLDYDIRFTPAATLDVVRYPDANWGTDVDDRRLTSGFYVFLGGNPVACGSKKQQVVSRSIAEAEYRGLAHAVTEVIWLESLLSELHVSPSRKATVRCDNSGAIAISANPIMHSKFKHVELDLYFVKEKVAVGKLSVGHVLVQEQIADVSLDAGSVLRNESQDDGSMLRNESSYGS